MSSVKEDSMPLRRALLFMATGRPQLAHATRWQCTRFHRCHERGHHNCEFLSFEFSSIKDLGHHLTLIQLGFGTLGGYETAV